MVNEEKFSNITINASLGSIHEATTKLTDIEFRYWINVCEKYPNMHPSHIEGMESDFISTGKWRFSGEREFEGVK